VRSNLNRYGELAYSWELLRAILKASPVSRLSIQALRELGWVDGRNIRFEIRRIAWETEQMRSFAKELIGLKPDLIVAATTPAVTALLEATQTVPIVFVQVIDPVGRGFIPNLGRPGGNVTGFVTFEFSMGGKWLETLKQAAPHVARSRPLLRSP